MKKSVLFIVSFCFLLVSNIGYAGGVNTNHPANHHPNQPAQETLNNTETPSGGAMVADALIARPMLLASTVAGSALFVATLPFTILSGSVKKAGKTLVARPAKATFTRCLGCTT